ncbi:hypothetical protein QCA50_000386 [Cerrena zonata]|uniref:1-alkyl-2-acetylglycerophosphocholine esterase n=1 Tax=Cerrena zonata TaxID=2478898 RepID=A0AAW0GWM1_9APHY
MFTLPNVQGRYEVGCTTFAATLPQEITIPSSKYKSSHIPGRVAHTPVLTMKQIAFTAFYPADIDSLRGSRSARKPRKTVPWLSGSVKEILRGYAHFGKVSFWMVYLLCRGLASHFKLPAYPNAPLLPPSRGKDNHGQPWPLVIFSHGLGGTRTNYSHICSRLASQGRVVLAIEHRDGTAPCVAKELPLSGLEKGFRPEYRHYTTVDDVYWEVDTGDKYAFKAEQLLYRRLEVYLTHRYLKALVESSATAFSSNVSHDPHFGTVDGPWNFNLDHRPDDSAFWSSWRRDSSTNVPPVDCTTNIDLAGHSFGGATVLSVLSQPPPYFSDKQFEPIAFKHALVLDPWMEPLPTPGPSPWKVEASLQSSPHSPKLFVINSEGFTLWDDHFDRLKGVVQIWRQHLLNPDDAGLVTIIRCKHISFSDFGVLIPFGRRAKEGKKLADIIFDLSDPFLDDRLGDTFKYHQLREDKTEEIKPKGAMDWSRRFVGELGDLIKHL